MSDQIRNVNQPASYLNQINNLNEEFATGKIDSSSYLNQLVKLELDALLGKADVNKNQVALEKPSEKAFNDLKGIGLEGLLSLISDENRKANLNHAEKRIANTKAERETNFQQTMDKINDAIKEAEKQRNASWWQKAFGFIANIITAIVSVCAIATMNPALVAVGVAGLYFAASGLTETITGEGLTTKLLKACHVRDDLAKYIGMGIDIVGGIATSIYNGAGIVKAISKFAETSAKTALFLSKTMNVTKWLNVAQQVGTGVAGGLNSYFTYNVEMTNADKQLLEKQLQKILTEDQEVQKLIKAIFEFMKAMTDGVNEVVKDKNQVQMNVMTLSPSGGMA